MQADWGSCASGEEGKEMGTLRGDGISIGIQGAKHVNLALSRYLVMCLLPFLWRLLGIIEFELPVLKKPCYGFRRRRVSCRKQDPLVHVLGDLIKGLQDSLRHTFLYVDGMAPGQGPLPTAHLQSFDTPTGEEGQQVQVLG